MAIFPKTRKIDFAEFQTADDSRAAKYGLPSNVTFCQRCVTSNQKPISAIEFQHTAASIKQAIHLDETNICDACRVTEKKASIDWRAREEELRALCDKHRSTDGSYDCLVPGSGGKDSFVAAHMLKYKYGMHPLTVTWAPHVYTEWGWRNFQRWIHAGFDNYLCTKRTSASSANSIGSRKSFSSVSSFHSWPKITCSKDGCSSSNSTRFLWRKRS